MRQYWRLSLFLALTAALFAPLPATSWQVSLVSVEGDVWTQEWRGYGYVPQDLVSGSVVSTLYDMNADYFINGEARTSLVLTGSACALDVNTSAFAGSADWAAGSGVCASASGVRVVFRIDRQPEDPPVTDVIVDWESACSRRCPTPGCMPDQTYSYVRGILTFDGLRSIDMATSHEGRAFANEQLVVENISDGQLIVFSNGVDAAEIKSCARCENDLNYATATARLSFVIEFPTAVPGERHTWGHVKNLFR